MVPYLLLFVVAVFATEVRVPECENGYTLGCPGKCNKTCDDYYNPPCEKCPTINCLIAECVCDPDQGFYYDGDDCIYKDKCPKPCPPECDKGYKLGCPDKCNRTCNDYYNPPCEECPIMECIRPECICDPEQGHYYNDKGDCVFKDQCPKPKPPECKKGYKLGCPDKCNRTCNDYYNPPCEECPIMECVRPECICDPEQGYYYNDKGDCVFKDQCPKPKPPECKKGYKLGCPDKCNRTCNDYYNPPCEECPIMECVRPECICDPEQGYYYNDKGDCVFKDQCPKPKPPECKKGYKLGCPDKCNRTCNDYYNPPCEECPIMECVRPECICDPEQGYYYNDKGDCVFKDKCPKPKPPKCKKGYKLGCPDKCNRTCNDYYNPPCEECPVKECIRPECICDPEQGYYYNDKGDCVFKDKCPKPKPPKCKKGYKLGCPGKCNRTCNDYYNPPCEECPIMECVRPECICDPEQGYYYNDKGDCVFKDKCPKPNPPVCKKGYKLGCPDKCNRTCNDYYNPPCEECPIIKCSRPECTCDPEQGHYYDGDKCIYKDDCPNPNPPKCDKGYELGCPDKCNRTCKDYYNPPAKKCPSIQCYVPVCVCDPKQGHYYDGKQCVPKDKCPKPKPPCPKGQEYVCDTDCNRTCADYFSPKKECPVVTCKRKVCKCDPKQGQYWHEKKKKCVHYKQCPKPSKGC